MFFCYKITTYNLIEKIFTFYTMIFYRTKIWKFLDGTNSEQKIYLKIRYTKNEKNKNNKKYSHD